MFAFANNKGKSPTKSLSTFSSPKKNLPSPMSIRAVQMIDNKLTVTGQLRVLLYFKGRLLILLIDNPLAKEQIENMASKEINDCEFFSNLIEMPPKDGEQLFCAVSFNNYIFHISIICIYL